MEAANTAAVLGGRPCAGRDAPMIPALRVFAFTGCAVIMLMWAVGFSESDLGEAWRLLSLASVLSN